MQVSDIVLKCVRFLGKAQIQGASVIEVDHCATGFFVSTPSIIIGGQFTYFVTAKHVAEALRDEHVYVMANRRGGGTTINFGIVENHFWFHPTDKTADVAVAQVAEAEPDADILPMSETMLLQKPFPKTIGIGSQVFMTGMFSLVSGNPFDLDSAQTIPVEPILRTGNIAMIPKSQIQTHYGFSDVYLIEARSLGGLSGSPVFVRETVQFPAKFADGRDGLASAYGDVRLLGMMHGHWDIRESDLNNPTIAPELRHGVNIGIGIVVPAEKILETINQPRLVEFRAEANTRYEREAKTSTGPPAAAAKKALTEAKKTPPMEKKNGKRLPRKRKPPGKGE
jgi:hypothetical protein